MFFIIKNIYNLYYKRFKSINGKLLNKIYSKRINYSIIGLSCENYLKCFN